MKNKILLLLCTCAAVSTFTALSTFLLPPITVFASPGNVTENVVEQGVQAANLEASKPALTTAENTDAAKKNDSVVKDTSTEDLQEVNPLYRGVLPASSLQNSLPEEAAGSYTQSGEETKSTRDAAAQDTTGDASIASIQEDGAELYQSYEAAGLALRQHMLNRETTIRLSVQLPPGTQTDQQSSQEAGLETTEGPGTSQEEEATETAEDPKTNLEATEMAEDPKTNLEATETAEDPKTNLEATETTEDIKANLEAADAAEDPGSTPEKDTTSVVSATWFSDMVHAILSRAFDITDDPAQGDYLNFGYLGFRARSTAGGREGEMYKGTITFYFTYSTTQEQEAQLAADAADVLRSLQLDGKDDVTRIRAIYDYVTDHVTYDHAHGTDYHLKYSAYAALENGTAVCQGYASLLYYFLKAEGIDTRIIPGLAGNVKHTWNIAPIDGQYYNLDSTWDAGTRAAGYSWFLCGSEDFPSHVREDAYNTAAFQAAYPMADQNYQESVDKKNVDKKNVDNKEDGWHQVDGIFYWYENNLRQGTAQDPKSIWAEDGTVRGREIYDPVSDAWYWLDGNADGAMARSKDVYIPYTYQGQDQTGKWVRYDQQGHMVKGWDTNQNGTWYFDEITGAMAKGTQTIDDQLWYFDEITGKLSKGKSSR